MSASPLLRNLLCLAAGLLLGGTSAGAAPATPGQPFTSSCGLQLVWVPPGYWVGQTEVTQEQYQALTADNPSRWRGPRHPVENVPWAAAVRWCEVLTTRDRAAGLLPEGWSYALPSEQQWEAFVGGARLEDMVHGRWQGLTPLGTQPVASRGPNQYGLYDVRGNVWEWCSDWWDHKHNERVLRGGSWDLVQAEDLDASYRPVSAAVARSGNLGFRVVLQRLAP